LELVPGVEASLEGSPERVVFGEGHKPRTGE